MDNIGAIKTRLLSPLLNTLHVFLLLFSITAELHIFIHKHSPAFYLLPLFFILLIPAIQWLLSHSRNTNVYLVDYSCLRPPTTCRVPIAAFLEHLSQIDCFDEPSKSFMSKVIRTSGIGHETYFPPPLHYIPPIPRHDDAIKEAEMLLFPTLDNLFLKTKVKPSKVDVIVLNCSGFCPVPSLSSMIVHHYKLREDVKSFNLSGMGCSAGAIGVDIAKGVLATGRGKYAIVVSTEIVSTGWYPGKDRRKLLLNCLFRMGASAVLLTNKKPNSTAAHRCKFKYKLKHLVRTQRAFDDRSYKSAAREEDNEGITGFSIERDLLKVAAETLRSGVSAIAPMLLPFDEKARYVLACAKRKLLQVTKKESILAVPDFKTAAKHFCLPASGKAVIDEIGKGIGLTNRETEAASATFHRFGNQSAASIWYQLAYTEAKGRVKKGDVVWQLAMGSGPKSNSMVWEAIRDIEEDEEGINGPWSGCIHRYPLRCTSNGRDDIL